MTQENSRIKAAGVRMALRMIPDDLMAQAPSRLAEHLNARLHDVQLEQGEQLAAYLLAGQGDTMNIATVAMDGQGRVTRRIGDTLSMEELFNNIINQIKEQ